jgi:hypothetical protein
MCMYVYACMQVRRVRQACMLKVCMDECMCIACMHGCMYAHTHVGRYVYMRTCMYACMHECLNEAGVRQTVTYPLHQRMVHEPIKIVWQTVHVRMHACTHLTHTFQLWFCTYGCIDARVKCMCMHVYVCISMHVYVCMCVGMYVCICMHVCTYM